MKNNKAPGIREINVDMLKAGGEQCLMWLTDILRAVWEEESILVTAACPEDIGQNIRQTNPCDSRN